MYLLKPTYPEFITRPSSSKPFLAATVQVTTPLPLPDKDLGTKIFSAEMFSFTSSLAQILYSTKECEDGGLAMPVLAASRQLCFAAASSYWPYFLHPVMGGGGRARHDNHHTL